MGKLKFEELSFMQLLLLYTAFLMQHKKKKPKRLLTEIILGHGSQSTVISASTTKLLEMQNLTLHPKFSNLECAFEQDPQVIHMHSNVWKTLWYLIPYTVVILQRSEFGHRWHGLGRHHVEERNQRSEVSLDSVTSSPEHMNHFSDLQLPSW